MGSVQVAERLTWFCPAYNKQKDLLSSTTGHFSLLKALHMADYITELNGKKETL